MNKIDLALAVTTTVSLGSSFHWRLARKLVERRPSSRHHATAERRLNSCCLGSRGVLTQFSASDIRPTANEMVLLTDGTWKRVPGGHDPWGDAPRPATCVVYFITVVETCF